MAEPEAIDPTTPGEWQFAVDLAAVALLVDAARKYGLISGGIAVDVERAEEVIARGKAQGIVARPIESLLEDGVGGVEVDATEGVATFYCGEVALLVLPTPGLTTSHGVCPTHGPERVLAWESVPEQVEPGG